MQQFQVIRFHNHTIIKRQVLKALKTKKKLKETLVSEENKLNS